MTNKDDIKCVMCEKTLYEVRNIKYQGMKKFLCLRCASIYEDIKEYSLYFSKMFVMFDPEKFGGCFVATRWIVKERPELIEEVVQIEKDKKIIAHSIAITPKGNIIDTQIYQFGLIMDIPMRLVFKGIFSREEHEKLLPRAKNEQRT